MFDLIFNDLGFMWQLFILALVVIAGMIELFKYLQKIKPKEMIHIQTRPWLIPAIILAVLITGYAFRWENTAQKSYDWGVTKWTRDRWTGAVWAEVYTPSGSQKRIISKAIEETDKALRLQKALTRMWVTSLAADIIYLCVSLARKTTIEQATENA